MDKLSVIIAVFLLFIGIYMMAFGTIGTIDALDDQPQDCRTHNNVVEYYENGTVKLNDTSTVVEVAHDEGAGQAWGMPGVTVHLLIALFGLIITIIFGVAAVMVSNTSY